MGYHIYSFEKLNIFEYLRIALLLILTHFSSNILFYNSKVERPLSISRHFLIISKVDLLIVLFLPDPGLLWIPLFSFIALSPIDSLLFNPLMFLLTTCIPVRSAWWKDEMSIFFQFLQPVTSSDWVSSCWLWLLSYC